VVIAVVFALCYLLISGLRRSRAGQRMLAMKSSPAAAATIGMDVTRVKLATFALSAGMAGVGGALYAGTLGVVSPETFSFFESLSLLLLTVVGGIGTAAGALFTGIFLGGYPIAVGLWAWLADLNRVLPGTMGLALARNPNGAVREITERYRILGDVPSTLIGLIATLVGATALALADTISGWALTFTVIGALVVWPQVATVVLRRRPAGTADGPGSTDSASTDSGPLERPERAGLDAPLSDAEVALLDRRLGIGGTR
jgi:branched-chain amino acid transport system permease protein